MIFNSFTFIIFLFIFTIIYWSLDNNKNIYLIFFSSLIFYGFWRLDFLILLIISLVFNFIISFKINNSFFKKKYIFISVFFNLFILFVFKYLIFFVEISNSILNFFKLDVINFNYKIILPIGISFYTFQAISYAIDLYKKKIKLEKNFFVFSSYIIFFPQLVAGPILRAGDVIYQLVSKKKFNNNVYYLGIQRVCIGLFLKCFLSNNLSIFVDNGFNQNPSYLSAIDVMTLSYLFGFQIYFDFAAYSHIAIGSALMLGIYFPENFNFPYHSCNPKEFWKKWHISLSTWVRDYIYIPFQKKFGLFKDNLLFISYSSLSLFFTWSLMGLWHGASWNFVLWGIYHFFLIIFFRKIKFKYNFLSLIIFIQLIMLSWILFRSPNISFAVQMYENLFSTHKWTYLSLRENTYIIAFITLLSYMVMPYIHNKIKNYKYRKKKKFLFLEIFFLIFIIYISFLYMNKLDQFIYFQF